MTDLINPQDLLDQLEEPTKFDFEVTRICQACGTVKTLTFFGRLSLESWIRIFTTEQGNEFFCESCRTDEEYRSTNSI